MPSYTVRVDVRLKTGVLDPQGAAIAQALEGLGFADVAEVRQGKMFEIEIADAPSEADAKARAEAMAEKLLANTVIERFEAQVL